MENGSFMHTRQHTHVSELFGNNLNLTAVRGTILQNKSIKIHFALVIQTAKVSVHNPHTVGLVLCLVLFGLSRRHNRT